MTERERELVERRRRISEWVAEGWTERQIAAELGVSQQTINRFLRTHNQPTRFARKRGAQREA